MAMQPSRSAHSSGVQPRTMPAATTSAAKKKCTEKLECPRMPSFMPRNAAANFSLQRRRGLATPAGSTSPVWLGDDMDFQCFRVFRRHEVYRVGPVAAKPDWRKHWSGFDGRRKLFLA